MHSRTLGGLRIEHVFARRNRRARRAAQCTRLAKGCNDKIEGLIEVAMGRSSTPDLPVVDLDGNNQIRIDSRVFSLDHYTIDKQIGAGANGVVFKVFNKILKRDEALKIWIRRRAHDRRPKIMQGMFEAQKQASEISDKVIKIYQAGVSSEHFYTTMEFYESTNLRQALKEMSEQGAWLTRFQVGVAYVFLIEKTTSPRLVHGDPHAGNVLVGHERPPPNSFERIKLKLCDYGTSHFNGKAASEERHWAVVAQTLEEIFAPFETWQANRELCLKSWELGEGSKYNFAVLKEFMGPLWGDIYKLQKSRAKEGSSPKSL